MKKYRWAFAFWLISIIAVNCFGKEIDFNKLEKKRGLYYQKDSGVLFTGDAISLNGFGVLIERIQIKSGLLNGEWTKYDDDGTKIGEGIFKNGNGIFYLYHDYEKKILLEETPYENNLLQGRSLNYFENGKIVLEENYDKDELHGRQIFWSENGSIVISKEWKHGMLNGKWLEFYETGEKEGEGIFNNGTGNMVRWYEDGAIKERTSFKNSMEDGMSISWYKNGKKSDETYFKKGMVHGELIEWDENGKITKDEVYKNGYFCYSKIKK